MTISSLSLYIFSGLHFVLSSDKAGFPATWGLSVLNAWVVQVGSRVNLLRRFEVIENGVTR
jgi:hypothetical protein